MFYSGNDFANPNFPREVLIGGGNNKNVSSTKQSFNGALVVISTSAAGTPYTTSQGVAPFAIVGALLTDSGSPSINQPPVNTVPATQTVLEDTPLAFSTANGNRISINDPDAASASVRVTLTITGGTASIGTAGLSVTGNGGTSIVATGSISNLNAALGSLVFTPTPNGNGAGSIAVLTDDLGNTGAGGSQTDSDTVAINVTAGTSTFAVSAGQATYYSNDEGRSLVVDSSGNVFVAGTFYYADEGGDAPGGNRADVYLARFSPTGALVWQQIIGTSAGDDRATAIARDAAGNLYVTGEFQGTVDFNAGWGVNNLTATSWTAAIFVLKLDANGVFQWVKGYGTGAGLSVGYRIAVDAAGNVLVTGQYSGTVNFNPGGTATNLTNAGSTDIFVLKLSSAGVLQWVKGFGSWSGDRGVAIATDATNRVYVTGAFSQTIDFDPGTGASYLTSAGGTDAFVLRFNAHGTFSFADPMGG